MRFRWVHFNCSRSKIFEDENDDEDEYESIPALTLFSDNFYQYPLPSFTVEFTVENFFPRTEIELPFCDRNDYFTPHYSSFEMSVRVVLGAVVSVLVIGLLWSQFFKPHLKVAMQTRLIVVDKDARRNMHRVY